MNLIERELAFAYAGIAERARAEEIRLPPFEAFGNLPSTVTPAEAGGRKY